MRLSPHGDSAVMMLTCEYTVDKDGLVKAKITAQPNLNAAPAEPGEPYRAYSLADGSVSYFITEPGAPAHPAILMQQAGAGGAMTNTGCAYGDKAAYGQLMTYLTSLKVGHR